MKFFLKFFQKFPMKNMNQKYFISFMSNFRLFLWNSFPRIWQIEYQFYCFVTFLISFEDLQICNKTMPVICLDFGCMDSYQKWIQGSKVYSIQTLFQHHCPPALPPASKWFSSNFPHYYWNKKLVAVSPLSFWSTLTQRRLLNPHSVHKQL